MPAVIRVPDVVGVRLTGRLQPGVTATDLALTLCERLRRLELADRFLEFFGPGVASLAAGERAVVANMAPEFGASCAFFPVDEQVLRYLRDTGRSAAHARLVEDYARRQALWLEPRRAPLYGDVGFRSRSGRGLARRSPAPPGSNRRGCHGSGTRAPARRSQRCAQPRAAP